MTTPDQPIPGEAIEAVLDVLTDWPRDKYPDRRLMVHIEQERSARSFVTAAYPAIRASVVAELKARIKRIQSELDKGIRDGISDDVIVVSQWAHDELSDCLAAIEEEQGE